MGEVEKFPGHGGWYFVRIPKEITDELRKNKRHWGLVTISVKVDSLEWETSLLPIGEQPIS